MKLKKLFALLTAGAMMTGLAACGSNGGTAGASVNGAASGDATVIQVGFENSISEPFGQGLVKWQELVDEKSNGTLKIELFPDSQLGSKAELIDSMLLSDPGGRRVLRRLRRAGFWHRLRAVPVRQLG